MKEVHLICNAHLDPIWQWEWEEGAAAALSTFRSAVDLAKDFDYIFCHNEVTLYKYIEEYAPGLFSEIKKLIREGRWHIMGGWYLQPDCNMPQGESFVRQIQFGHRYFMEKFGVNPTTAINFDAFGHSWGLPQIMAKCGQDSCILTRAGDDPIPARTFVWEGVDGSRIKVYASPFGYNTPLGGAAQAIRDRANAQEGDTVCVLWGVGNHGGGPSRKDLAAIEAMQKELGDDMTILHSTPEQFFAKINPEVVHRGALRIAMPGCYTSMTLVKQKHAELENTLYMTEKLCSVAAMRGLIAYPKEELDDATEDLLNAEFHDVLPGSAIRAGEDNGLRLLQHGLLTLNRLRARAFFAMSSSMPRAAEGEFPIMVFNPQPYEWDTEIVCEMMLSDQNWSDEICSRMRVYNAAGEEIKAQVIKEESNLNLDWRKRFVFRAPLAPLDVTRFSVYVDYVPAQPKTPLLCGDDICFDCEVPDSGNRITKHVEIDGKTGLLRSFALNGVELISGTPYLGVVGAGLPVMYDDTPDPWGMQAFQLSGMGDHPTPFTLYTPDSTGVISEGPFVGMSPIQIAEDGCVYTKVECYFQHKNTKVRMEYTLYKTNPSIDIRADVFMQDADHMVKLAFPLTAAGEVLGQTAFGTEELYKNGRENVAQRFVGVRTCGGSDDVTVLFNRGTYGSSYKDGVLSMSLVRGVSYCAHPIGDREIIPHDKFVKKMDLGERNFFFRFTTAKEETLERLAAEYNVPPYACNVFPWDTGLLGEENSSAQTAAAENAHIVPTLSDRNIVLITMKQQTWNNTDTEDAYLLRLMNNDRHSHTCTCTMGDSEITLSFGAYEAKTVKYSHGTLTEESAFLI
ncbi:MAG: alpha-mannosidase [Clostridia bacterium]|nr:alpha-mannosidase [Clostridia bacterium]